jgi:hypothetical protein
MTKMDKLIAQDLETFDSGRGLNGHPQGTGVFL